MDHETALLLRWWILHLLVYRTLIIAAGMLSVALGYRLFANLGSRNGKTSFEGEWKGFSLRLKEAAPGTCFALFGAAIIVWMMFRPPQFESENKIIERIRNPVTQITTQSPANGVTERQEKVTPSAERRRQSNKSNLTNGMPLSPDDDQQQLEQQQSTTRGPQKTSQESTTGIYNKLKIQQVPPDKGSSSSPPPNDRPAQPTRSPVSPNSALPNPANKSKDTPQ